MKYLAALVLILIPVLLATPAFAQQRYQEPPMGRTYDQSTPLGKAMSLCQLHSHGQSINATTAVVQYDGGWANGPQAHCDAIRSAWEATPEATKFHAAEAPQLSSQPISSLEEAHRERAARDVGRAARSATEAQSIEGIYKGLTK